MNAKELLEKLNQTPAVEPDEWESEAILYAEAEKASGSRELISLEELQDRTAKANGRISLRVPRQLHIDLIADAEEQGVSLNQYISFILASRPR